MFKNSLLSSLPITTRGIVLVMFGLICFIIVFLMISPGTAQLSAGDKGYSIFMLAMTCILGILGMVCAIAGSMTLFRAANELRQGAPQPTTANSGQIKIQPATIEQELQKAADMLQKGLIDDDEYKELKKKIMSKF